MKGKIKKIIAGAAVCAAAVIAVVAAVSPLAVRAAVTKGHSYSYGNDQIYGLVIWGTSNVSRIYEDVSYELYATGEASSDRTGQTELDQHVWTSQVKSGTSSYDYRDYNVYGYGTINDARTIATAPSGNSSTQSDLSGNIFNVSTGTWTTLVSSGDVVNFGQGVQRGLDAAKALWWDYDHQNEDDYKDDEGNIESWPDPKTAVVIYAGEDWIVNGSNTSGISDAASLQFDWMGQNTVEIGEDLAAANGATMSVSYANSGIDIHSYWPASGSTQDIKLGEAADVNGYYISSDDVTDGSVHSASASTTSDVLSGANGNDDYRHSLVWGNSYQIRDSYLYNDWEDDGTGHMTSGSGFVYSGGESSSSTADSSTGTGSTENSGYSTGSTESVSLLVDSSDPNNIIGEINGVYLYEYDSDMDVISGEMLGESVFVNSSGNIIGVYVKSDGTVQVNNTVHVSSGGKTVEFITYLIDEDGNYLGIIDGNELKSSSGNVIATRSETQFASYADGHIYEGTVETTYRVTSVDEDGNTSSSVSSSSSTTLEHLVTSLTDEYDSTSNLPTQAATTFGRILNGYDYQVEYLEQDTSQTSDIDDVDEYTETVTIWVPEYTEDEIEYIETHKYYNTYTLRDDGGEAGSYYFTNILTDADGSPYIEDIEYDVQLTNVTAVYHTESDTDSEGNTTHERVFDYYEYTYTVYRTIRYYYPASVVWRQVDVSVHVRCDQDRSADAGYADSSHTHVYGASGSSDGTITMILTGDVVDGYAGSDFVSDYKNAGWENVSYYIGTDAANGTYVSLDGTTYILGVSEYDGEAVQGGSTTYVGSGVYGGAEGQAWLSEIFGQTADHLEWYTNPDKPIMKVVSETRHVNGYIEYWRECTNSSLKVYLVGLGPYDKSDYDDEKDHSWTDHVIDSQAEVDQTDDFTKARQTWNTMLKSTASSGTFIDDYDLALASTPYYRYQSISYMSADSISNATHGKWYDRNFNEWFFHMIWNTILEDNPDSDEYDAIQTVSFYSLSATLTAYANQVVSSVGRSGLTGSSASSDSSVAGVDEGGGAVEEGDEDEHVLSDVYAAGMSGAGAILGYGDESYGFAEYIATNLSGTSTTVDYDALPGVEGTGGNDSPTYEYARYGHLLEELGLDETGTDQLVSSRTIPGLLVDAGYIANAGLVMIWDLSLQALKWLNPFQILARVGDTAAIAQEVTAPITVTDPFTGELTETTGAILEWTDAGLAQITSNPAVTFTQGTTSYTLDSTNSLLLSFATSNTAMGSLLTGIGVLYNTLEHLGWIMIVFWLAILIAGILLSRVFVNGSRNTGNRVLRFVTRFVFLAIAIPLMGFAWTGFINQVADTVTVVQAPSSELVASTFVDFKGWVETSRLSPVSDGSGTALFKSDASSSEPGGSASAESVMNLRKTAALINYSTGVLPGVDARNFTGTMTEAKVAEMNSEGDWNDMISFAYGDIDSEIWVKLDSGTSSGENAYGTATTWKDSYDALTETFAFLNSYMSGEFYYAGTFSSETLSFASSTLADSLGYRGSSSDSRTAIPDSETGEADTSALFSNDNTLYQMFTETSSLEKWASRTALENREIFTGTGKYAGIGDDDEESGSDWSAFNVFANGAMQASADTSGSVGTGSSITYTAGTQDLKAGTSSGIDVRSKTGLSSLSMYNYLMTDFGDGSLTVYSSENVASGNVSKAHYATNIIGTGPVRWAFYLSCLAFLLAAGIVGVVYALGMAWHVVKRSCRMIVSVPAAMLGAFRSIVLVVSTFVMMFVEVIGTMLLYNVVAYLLTMIVTLSDWAATSLVGWAASQTATVIGGVPAEMSAAVTGLAGSSVACYALWLFGSAAILLLLSVWLVKKAPAFLHAFGLVQDILLMKLYPCMAEAYAREPEPASERRPQREPVPGFGTALAGAVMDAVRA